MRVLKPHLCKFVFLVFLLVCLSPVSLYFGSEIPGTEFIIPFYIFGGIFLAAGICRIGCTRTFSITKPDIIAAALFVWVVISGILINDSPRELTAIAKITYPFLFYLLFRLLLTPKYIPWFFFALVLAAAGQIIVCCCSFPAGVYAGHTSRGSFFSSALLGGFLAVACIAMAGSAMRLKNTRKLNRTLLWSIILALLAVQLFFIFRTNSRASLYALAISSLFVLFYGIKMKKPVWINIVKRYKVILSACLACILLGGVLGLYFLRPASANGRLLIWEASRYMIGDKPLAGHGIDGFRQNYMFYQAKYIEENPEHPFAMLASDNALAFNEFIRICAEYGVIGLCIACCLIFTCLRTVPKEPEEKPNAFLLKTTIVSIFVFGLFSYPLDVFQFRLILCICITFLAQLSPEIYTLSLPGSAFRKLLPVAGSALLCVYLLAGVPVFRFAKATAAFSSLVHSDTKPEDQCFLLEQLYPALCHSMEYLHYYGELLNSRNDPERALRNYRQLESYFPSSYQQIEKGMALQALGRIPEAHAAWSLAGQMVPALIKPHYLLTKSFYECGDMQQASRHAKIVLTKKIKVYTPEIYYMKQEIKELSKKLACPN